MKATTHTGEITRSRVSTCRTHHVRPPTFDFPSSRQQVAAGLRRNAADPSYPVEGGSANDYDYCDADPINCTDLNGLYGYNYSYKIGKVGSWQQVERIFALFNSTFNKVFPLAGNCGSTLWVGKQCSLTGGGKIQVLQVGSRHFVFKSLEGHPEGPDKYINFTLDMRGGYLYLNVSATGPDNFWQKLPGVKRGNRLFAHEAWQKFANNIGKLARYA